jgi:hypothetical protein
MGVSRSIRDRSIQETNMTDAIHLRPTSTTDRPPQTGARVVAGPERPVVMTLEQMANAVPVPPIEAVPERFKPAPTVEPPLYIASLREPEVTLTKERVDDPGGPPIWKISIHSTKKVSPGIFVASHDRVEARAIVGHERVNGTTAHRPAWVGLEYYPKVIPHRRPLVAQRAANPTVAAPPMKLLHGHNQEAVSTFFPWRTIGKVFVGTDPNFRDPSGWGTGVLVGPNLMMTASHVVPWEATSGLWWMRFAPGFREGEPQGSSFVTRVRGIRIDDDSDPSGYDYVICRLQQPLGAALGWMGSQSFGDEDDYTNGRWISVGYPGWFFGGNRPAVEFDIDIDDIDNDDPGVELETNYGDAFGGGWSGGPLWGIIGNQARIIGIKSGWEVDGYDPARGVFSGGRLMVDLIKHGLAHFQ